MFPQYEIHLPLPEGVVPELAAVLPELVPVFLLEGDVVVPPVQVGQLHPAGGSRPVLPPADQGPAPVGAASPQDFPVFVLSPHLAPAGGVPEGDEALLSVGVVTPVFVCALAPMALEEAVAGRVLPGVRAGGRGQGQERQQRQECRKQMFHVKHLTFSFSRISAINTP